MFVTGTKLLVRRGSSIRTLRDLEGKTIVLTRGTVHETSIPKLAERQKLPIKFVFAADHNESFQALAVGQGGRVRERRRAALRHAGGNAIGAAIFASSAIS